MEYFRSPTLNTEEDVKRELFELYRRVAVLERTVGLVIGFGLEAPDKPQEGMIAYANGSEWDPGSGAGLYKYLGGGWVLL